LRSRTASVALSLLMVLGLAVPHAVVAAAPPLRVVIVVGPVDDGAAHDFGACGTVTFTSYYRCLGDTAAVDAAQALPGATIVKVYSPNATWDAVRSALQGANLVVYLGHGNGYPSPYTSGLSVGGQDGFGLNDPTNRNDTTAKYYGESYIAGQVHLAPNAAVILSHLCYASGNSEPQNAAPSLDVAEKRIDNYAAGFIAAGARAVIAESYWDPGVYFGLLSKPGQSVEQIWRTMSYAHGNARSFASVRDPGFTAWYDPDTAAGIYHRSLVVWPGLSTTLVSATDYSSTGTDPSTFQVPGAASVTGTGTLKTSATLQTAEPTSLSAGTAVRLLAEAAPLGDGTRVFQVATLDGTVTGYLPASSLIPRDSTPPTLWALDDMGGTFSPNGDGIADTLVLRGDFSETVSYNVRFTSQDGSKVYSTVTGASDVLDASWAGTSGATALPDGTYRWSLHATDAWGNAPFDLAEDVVISRIGAARLAGSDRYTTAAAISAATYAPGVPVAYVATGLGFPDALAGAAAAGRTGGPVLLVAPTSIPASTASELGRLKPARIVILGGTGAVSDAVAAALGAYTPGGVTRLAGPDRYATAAAISAATFAPGVPVAYIATGLNFPDALSGAAAAGTTGGPILLVPGDGIPAVTAAELTRLKPGRIVILGGASVVSDAVAAALAPFTSGGVSRLAGADRYATSAAISAATFAPGVPIAYVATGLNFPDALAGAAAAGKTHGPVLLVPGTSIPASTAAELARLRPAQIAVLGSSGVVSSAVQAALGAYIP
jgi:putative cell wall-binding protein